MEKIFIKNRDNKNLAVTYDILEPARGLVFIAHGLGGFKEQDHIQTFKEAFQESGYSTILWDARDTLGESEGKMEDATITSYFHDLEDVIAWAKMQPWYEEPFILCGHSLGGIISILFAEKHPEKVKALAPVSTVVSGKLSVETDFYKESLTSWKERGYIEYGSISKPGMMKRLNWNHVEDLLRYDVLKKINRLTMPVLLMVGSNDKSTLPDHQKILFNAIPAANKELHVIDGAPHTFRKPGHLAKIKRILKQWIKIIQHQP